MALTPRVAGGRGSPHCEAAGSHLVGPFHHGLDEGCGLVGTGAHSLRPSLAEHPGHGGFIGQAELAPVLGNTEGEPGR